MIVNTETDFLPIPDELIVNLEDSKSLILDLLENLPLMFSESTVFESNLGAAVKAIGMIAKPTGGKVFVFDGSPISSKFPHLRPTDKPGVQERNELLLPTNALFKNTGSELSHFYVSVDLFVVNSTNTYKNISTYSDLARSSNGRLYYYSKFSPHQHGIKLDTEFASVLTAKVAWEAVGRVRVSSGYQQIGTHGNYLIKARTADLLSLPSCDEHR